jgi:serine/threonine protein kinase
MMLSGNKLHTLPETMSACTSLELLRIAANRFTALPDWLLQLPRLSWLAFAGNPCSELHEDKARSENVIDEIHWRQLDMQHKLGEGASGVIHQAAWNRNSGQSENVAVKLFKGAMTSDGLPHSEKTAAISAGTHPNLINVHGKVIGHPSGLSGLIMSLIAPSFRNLAGPPSLDSCTRDIYAADCSFTLATALSIATSIASAAKQLHDKGIMHGDLYAHNILHSGEGACLLGDFGAASFYRLQDQPRAEALQRLEVRAFGCLLEELLERCVTVDENQDILKTLKKLQENCMQANNASRPLFGGILRILEEQICKNSIVD